jgi:alpha-beta hydrolase superfamily lysophospholipase
MIDLDALGFSSGVRCSGFIIPNFHRNVNALILQMAKYPDLPTFLYGNSMGCMVLTTYLQRNPDLRIAGVVFSAPFFYLPECLEGRDRKLAIIPYIAQGIKDFVLASHIKKASVALND